MIKLCNFSKEVKKTCKDQKTNKIINKSWKKDEYDELR